MVLNFNPTECSSSCRRGEAEAKINLWDRLIDIIFLRTIMVEFIANIFLPVNG
jgi:hypothetical protein